MSEILPPKNEDNSKKKTIQGVPESLLDSIENIRESSATLHQGAPSKKDIAGETQEPIGDVSYAQTMVAQSENLDITQGASESLLFDNITTEHPRRYLYKNEIGVGGIGKVTLSYDTHIGRNVAIKELLPRFTSCLGHSESTLRNSLLNHSEIRFLNEARITGYLEHPGIVPVYEMGKREDGGIYYTMKFVEGRTFSSMIEGKTLLERLELLNNFLEVCNAIAYAHSRGVIHRDLKPENIMLGKFGETIVLDWGLAKKIDDEDITRGELEIELEKLNTAMALESTAGGPMGTPQYMPPEQARGEIDTVDERSDVYTLGAILYEILTGVPPFTGNSPLSVVLAVVMEKIKSPLSLDDNIPPELSAIAEKALSKEKDDRYASALELAAEIRRWQNGGLVRSYDYSISDLLIKWVVKNRKVIIIASTLFFTFLGAWAIRGKSEVRRQARVEKARQEVVVKEVKSIMAQVGKKGHKSANWLDIYVFKLISLKEDVTEDYLISQISHSDKYVRKIVIKALGGMKSTKSVKTFIERLEKKKEISPALIIEIIKTLGVIGDPRANRVVQNLRWENKQGSQFWYSTKTAYEMIPVSQNVNLKQLTFDELYMRGKAYYNKGKIEKSKKIFLLCIAKDPTNYKPYNMLGIISKRNEHAGEAIKYYTKSLELNSDKAQFVLTNRAQVYRMIEKYDLALKDYNDAIAIEPTMGTNYNNRAILYFAMGEDEKSIKDYKKAIALKPKSRLYASNLSSNYFQTGNIQKAKVWIKKSLSLNPKNIYSNVHLMKILIFEKKYNDAAAIMDKMFEIDPNNLALHYYSLLLNYYKNSTTGIKQILNLLSESTNLSRYANEILSLGYYLLGEYEKGNAASLKSFNKRGVNAKVKQYLTIRRIPLLIKLGKPDEYKKPLKTLVDSKAPQWIDMLSLYLLGEIEHSKLKENAISRRRKFDLYFYTGLKAQLDKLPSRARKYYQKTIETPCINEIEYVYAQKYLESISNE